MRTFPSADLTDGYRHLFFPNVSRPTAFCGTTLHKIETDDPRAAIENQRQPLSAVTCPECLRKADDKGLGGS